MELILTPEQVTHPLGLTITVKSFTGDVSAEVPSQVFVEVNNGVLRVHLWNGKEDPTFTTEIEPLNPKPSARPSTRTSQHG